MWAPKGSGTGQVTWPHVVDYLYTNVGDSTQEEGDRHKVPFHRHMHPDVCSPISFPYGFPKGNPTIQMPLISWQNSQDPY